MVTHLSYPVGFFDGVAIYDDPKMPSDTIKVLNEADMRLRGKPFVGAKDRIFIVKHPETEIFGHDEALRKIIRDSMKRTHLH